MPTVKIFTPSFDASSAASQRLAVGVLAVGEQQDHLRRASRPPLRRAARVSRSSAARMARPIAVPPTGMSQGPRSRQNSFTAA